MLVDLAEKLCGWTFLYHPQKKDQTLPSQVKLTPFLRRLEDAPGECWGWQDL